MLLNRLTYNLDQRFSRLQFAMTYVHPSTTISRNMDYYIDRKLESSGSEEFMNGKLHPVWIKSQVDRNHRDIQTAMRHYIIMRKYYE